MFTPMLQNLLRTQVLRLKVLALKIETVPVKKNQNSHRVTVDFHQGAHVQISLNGMDE